MTASDAALVWLVAGSVIGLAILYIALIVSHFTTPKVEHPFREDIPEWWG